MVLEADVNGIAGVWSFYRQWEQHYGQYASMPGIRGIVVVLVVGIPTVAWRRARLARHIWSTDLPTRGSFSRDALAHKYREVAGVLNPISPLQMSVLGARRVSYAPPAP